MQHIDPNAAATGDGIFGLPFTAEQSRVVLVPVPFDVTTSYRPGTADGPRAILAASVQVDLHDGQTGEPWQGGIHMLEEPAHIRELNERTRPHAERVMAAEHGEDAGAGIAAARDEVNAAGATVNGWLQRQVETQIAAGKLVGTVGGDHATPFGAIAAHAQRYPGMGILHIDAHCDLRRAYNGFEWSHASIMENVVRKLPGVSRLVQVGVRDYCEEEVQCIRRAAGRVVTWFDAELAAERFEGMAFGAQVRRAVAALPDEVYVSFDIDGLDPALCPHTGTPVPGGLSFDQASYLVGAVARSGRRIVGFDLVEVAPGPEGDEWDGNVGARVLYKLVGWMLRSQDRND